VTGAFLGTPLSLAAIAVLLWLPLRRVAGGSGPAVATHRLRELVARAWAPICALGLISWLQDGNVILVKHLASDDDAGAWVAAAVAAKAIMWIAIGLGSYVVAETARRAASAGDARGVLVRTIGLIGVVAVPMVLVYTGAAEFILSVVLNVDGAEGALPLFGAAMSLLALTYLATQFQLGLHRSRFLVVLAAAALAQPVIMISIGDELSALALGLLAMHAAVAATMLVLSLRRPPQRYASAAAPEADSRAGEPAAAAPSVT
jgi:hypothetical protein